MERLPAMDCTKQGRLGAISFSDASLFPLCHQLHTRQRKGPRAPEARPMSSCGPAVNCATWCFTFYYEKTKIEQKKKTNIPQSYKTRTLLLYQAFLQYFTTTGSIQGLPESRHSSDCVWLKRLRAARRRSRSSYSGKRGGVLCKKGIATIRCKIRSTRVCHELLIRCALRPHNLVSRFTARTQTPVACGPQRRRDGRPLLPLVLS